VVLRIRFCGVSKIRTGGANIATSLGKTAQIWVPGTRQLREGQQTLGGSNLSRKRVGALCFDRTSNVSTAEIGVQTGHAMHIMILVRPGINGRLEVEDRKTTNACQRVGPHTHGCVRTGGLGKTPKSETYEESLRFKKAVTDVRGGMLRFKDAKKERQLRDIQSVGGWKKTSGKQSGAPKSQKEI